MSSVSKGITKSYHFYLFNKRSTEGFDDNIDMQRGRIPNKAQDINNMQYERTIDTFGNEIVENFFYYPTTQYVYITCKNIFPFTVQTTNAFINFHEKNKSPYIKLLSKKDGEIERFLNDKTIAFLDQMTNLMNNIPNTKDYAIDFIQHKTTDDFYDNNTYEILVEINTLVIIREIDYNLNKQVNKYSTSTTVTVLDKQVIIYSDLPMYSFEGQLVVNTPKSYSTNRVDSSKYRLIIPMVFRHVRKVQPTFNGSDYLYGIPINCAVLLDLGTEVQDNVISYEFVFPYEIVTNPIKDFKKRNISNPYAMELISILQSNEFINNPYTEKFMNVLSKDSFVDFYFEMLLQSLENDELVDHSKTKELIALFQNDQFVKLFLELKRTSKDIISDIQKEYERKKQKRELLDQWESLLTGFPKVDDIFHKDDIDMQ